MPIFVPTYSRFGISSPIAYDNGIETFGLMKPYAFLDEKNLTQDEITVIKVTSDVAGRPDLIAWQLYNQPVLSWVIILFNKPLNPIGWPQTGTVIKVPDASAVFKEL